MIAATHDATHAAFEAFAEVYDTFTAHHDYELWIGAIEPLARRHGLTATGKLLDIGVGTGKSLQPWLDRGWIATGCDSSEAMLTKARAKIGDDAHLVPADARSLGDLGRFDLVQILDDVVNYLAPDELPALFAGVANNLAPGGVCVFDLSTRWLLGNFFSATEVAETEDHVVIWRGRQEGGVDVCGIVVADLDAFIRTDAGWRRQSGVHRQHHHPVEVVRAHLESAGLRLEGLYGQDFTATFEPGVDELRHTKSVLMARRANAPHG